MSVTRSSRRVGVPTLVDAGAARGRTVGQLAGPGSGPDSGPAAGPCPQTRFNLRRSLINPGSVGIRLAKGTRVRPTTWHLDCGRLNPGRPPAI